MNPYPPFEAGAIPIAGQDQALRRDWSGVATAILGHRLGAWKLVLTPFSTSYQVGVWLVLPARLDQADVMGGVQVRVLEPELRGRDDDPADPVPHVYRGQDGRITSLCLFDPGVESNGPEWQPSMLLARTIVPWAAEWLGFYELWLATGRWHGPEVRHAA